MAGKKKSAKEDSVSKGFQLPKSIAGVKLPKEARRKLGDLAKHPLVADIVAAGLIALAAKLKKDRKVRKAASDAVGAAEQTLKDTGAQVAEAAAEAVTAAAKPVVKRVRKPSATTTAPATRSAPEAKAAADAKPARKTKAQSAPAKPRTSTAGTAARKPRAPKAPKAE